MNEGDDHGSFTALDATLARLEAKLTAALEGGHSCPAREELARAHERVDQVELEVARMRAHRWRERLVCGGIGGAVGAALAVFL